jgi:micrococcal nuclease
MIRLVILALLFLSTVYSLAFVQKSASSDFPRTVQVRWIADGDTFATMGGETVRLQGIDTPEKGRKGKPDQYYAREARQALSEMVKGKEVSLTLGPRSKDRYGRLLALVSLPHETPPNEAMVNILMVRHGYAYYYPHRDHTPSLTERLLRAQKRAISEGAGFWPVILSLPKAGEPYTGNTRSRRFHGQDCPNVDGISPANRKEFPSLRHAFEAGFSPARECTPWPLSKEVGR